MEKEEWKPIKDYEGFYEVSSLGRVKSLGNDKKRIDKLLSPLIRSGYHYVNLSKKSKRKAYGIHQLVAIAFLNHTRDGYNLVVDHIDNNQKNNCLENLQVITHRQNTSKDRKNKSSKYIGVCFCKKSNKWVSRIRINKNRINLGYFNCELSASIAYQNKLKTIN